MTRETVRRALFALILPAVLGPAALGAQSSADSTRATVPLFTRSDAWLGAGFVVATVALFPLDRRLAERLQYKGTQENRLFHHLSTDVRLIAQPGSFVIGGSLYAVGRLAKKPRLADLGLHGTEAILVGSAVTGIIKGTVGRARPYATADTNPRSFGLFRGFLQGTDYLSFPSGHTLTAFAAAAAVTSETQGWWPGSQWYVGPLMYGGATAVGLSRMYNNKHWGSDVAVGAMIGTFSGLKVVRYHHRTHPGNKFDRWLLGASIAPDETGGRTLSLLLRPDRR